MTGKRAIEEIATRIIERVKIGWKLPVSVTVSNDTYKNMMALASGSMLCATHEGMDFAGIKIERSFDLGPDEIMYTYIDGRCSDG